MSPWAPSVAQDALVLSDGQTMMALEKIGNVKESKAEVLFEQLCSEVESHLKEKLQSPVLNMMCLKCSHDIPNQDVNKATG